jgi:hypothetical protein
VVCDEIAFVHQIETWGAAPKSLAGKGKVEAEKLKGNPVLRDGPYPARAASAQARSAHSPVFARSPKANAGKSTFEDRMKPNKIHYSNPRPGH